MMYSLRIDGVNIGVAEADCDKWTSVSFEGNIDTFYIDMRMRLDNKQSDSLFYVKGGAYDARSGKTIYRMSRRNSENLTYKQAYNRCIDGLHRGIKNWRRIERQYD